MLKIQRWHHTRSYLLYWYSSSRKRRLFNTYSPNDIKSPIVRNMQYLEWGYSLTLCMLYLSAASHASQLCDTSTCPAHPATWAAVASLIRKRRDWHAFSAAETAAFKAPAHRNSFFLLDKGDHAHLRSFVVFCRFIQILHHSPKRGGLKV